MLMSASSSAGVQAAEDTLVTDDNDDGFYVEHLGGVGVVCGGVNVNVGRSGGVRTLGVAGAGAGVPFSFRHVWISSPQTWER